MSCTIKHWQLSPQPSISVTSQQDLKWGKLMKNFCSKANRTPGFLRRSLQIRATKLKETVLRTLVRPIVEYACTVWDLSDPQWNMPAQCGIHTPRRTMTCLRMCSVEQLDLSSITPTADPASQQCLTALAGLPCSICRKLARLSMLYKMLHDDVMTDKDYPH